MKSCECGGKLHRHGTDSSGRQRFICAVCKKTVGADEDGNFTRPLPDMGYTPTKAIRGFTKDWRFN